MTKLGIIAGLCLASAVLALTPFPLPPDRHIADHASPGGSFIARAAWRPAGLLGLISGDNPWVYVNLVDEDSGNTIARYRTRGHVPGDVYTRVLDHEPWSRPEHPPWEGVELVLTTCANTLRGMQPGFIRSFHTFHGGGSTWECFEPEFHAYIGAVRRLCAAPLPPSPDEIHAAMRPVVERCIDKPD